MTLISLFHPWGDFEQVAEAACLAEAHGFHACLFGEHHGSPANDRPQLLVLLAALAAGTRTIRLGTSILLSPLYNPIAVAEAAAMVDVISNGRLILGLGLGYQPRDFEHFGVPFGQRLSRFEEGIAVIRAAWGPERFSFAGKRYQLSDVSVYPKPVQAPSPPLWLAAWSAEGARRAGRLGDAYVTDPIQNLGAIRAFAAEYRAAAETAGRPAEVVLMRELLVAPSRQEALDRYAEGLLATYRYYWQNGAFDLQYETRLRGVGSAVELTWELLAEDRVIWGTPEDCVGQIEHWCREAGSDHMQVAIPFPRAGMSQAHQLATIELVGTEIVSKLATPAGRR